MLSYEYSKFIIKKRYSMTSYNKNKALALYKYLQENSDENHPVTMKQICRYMEENGYPHSQDTVLRCMNQLRDEMGVDIISNKGRYANYFIGSRILNKDEIKPIIDAVNASNFIEKQNAKKIVGKLKSIVSIHEADEIGRTVLGVSVAKTENSKIMYNVDDIQRAINEGRQISCYYMKWNDKKELVPKNDEKIIINPWTFIWANDRYYLYGYVMKDALEERCYRVDKLSDIEVLNVPRKGEEEFKNFDATTYVSRRIGLFSGEEANITVKIPKDLVGPFIDQFGKNSVSIKQIDNEIVKVSFRAAATDMLYGWLIGLRDVEVISPQWVKKELIELIDKNRKYY